MLTVWFTDPCDEFICEEAGREIVLIKDRAGRAIGVERLRFSVLVDSVLLESTDR